MQFTLGLMPEREVDRVFAASMIAGQASQVFAIRDVLRARSTSMLGAMTAVPAPVRAYPKYWQASVSVEEDL